MFILISKQPWFTHFWQEQLSYAFPEEKIKTCMPEDKKTAIFLLYQPEFTLCQNLLRHFPYVILTAFLAAPTPKKDDVSLLAEERFFFLDMPFSLIPCLEMLSSLLKKSKKLYEEPLKFSFGSFFPEKRVILIPGKAPVWLTEKEVDFLSYLYKHPRVTKENLLENVWHHQKPTDSCTLETYVHRLRKKISTALWPDKKDWLCVQSGRYWLK